MIGRSRESFFSTKAKPEEEYIMLEYEVRHVQKERQILSHVLWEPTEKTPSENLAVTLFWAKSPSQSPSTVFSQTL
jgi:hypothetical protein